MGRHRAHVIKVGREDPAGRRETYNRMVPPPRLHGDERVMQLNSRPPIYWGIPFDEVCYSSWAIHMLAQRMVRASDGLLSTESTYVVLARNFIHEQFLKAEGDWLMLCDSDVLLPEGFVETAIRNFQERPDAGLMSGWYWKKVRGDAVPAVYKTWEDESSVSRYMPAEIEPLYKGSEVTPVAAVGLGCGLMSRAVAEKLGVEPYKMIEMGEDLDICKQIQDLGLKVYVMWNMMCKHVGVGII